jgi:hypothetical protein
MTKDNILNGIEKIETMNDLLKEKQYKRVEEKHTRKKICKTPVQVSAWKKK